MTEARVPSAVPQPGEWWWSSVHRTPVRVLEHVVLWDHDIVAVWLPAERAIANVAIDVLTPLADGPGPSAGELAWRAAAAKVADALGHGMLLAPLEGTVIPLPHQLKVLARAMSKDRVRYLLADEVGLGKTIEAGLVLREMKLRGRVARTLILAPKGLVNQWVQEMKNRFNETFHLMVPSDVPTLRRAGDGEENPWKMLNQVVCPMDGFKPLERRRGWSKEQLAAYNLERSGLLLSAGWDLIIVDEAHRLGGSTEDVARYRLGEAIAAASPYLLLLSATPHQGKTDSFVRLMRLLDRDHFPDAPLPSHIAPYVIRTEKRRAVDANGDPLFKPRRTRLCPVAWRAEQESQRDLYGAVTDYVRDGYNRALRERKFALGFLMILMQRLVTSSTRAIRTAMERRLATLNESLATPLFGAIPPADLIAELDDPEGDAQAMLDDALAGVPEAPTERVEVQHLLELARRVEADGPDAKAVTLLELMRGFRQAEENPDLKFLVFTEFIPTQQMLAEFLGAHGFRVTCLNGTMDLDTRRQVQDDFAGDAQVLLSTDAGGEGLNLQFCHIIVNYDLPWNPMRIEQRIGRVDRIGQAHEVTAVNLVFEDTVEHRVREVLEQKLATILAEFGVDKSGDVLESVDAGAAFDKLYAEVVVSPDQAAARVEALVADVRSRASSLRSHARLLDGDEDRSVPIDPEPARAVMNHPLPGWVEILVLRHLESAGGKWETREGVYTLHWADGSEQRGVFEPGEAARRSLPLLSIQDARIRRLALGVPGQAPGLPVPVTDWPGLTASVEGTFAVFRVSVDTGRRGPGDPRQELRILPVFVHADGRSLAPTARHLWDRLVSSPPPITGYRRGADGDRVIDGLRAVAHDQGRELFRELATGNGGAGLPRLEPLVALVVRRERA